MTRKERKAFMELVRQHYNTVPTSIINRIMGSETWTDPISLPAGTTIGGGFAGTNTPVAVPAATTTLTLAPGTHAGKWVTLACTGGLVITPPAATGTGNTYRLFVTASITGGNLTLDAKAGNATDVFYGFAYTYKATTFTNYATASNTNLITWDGSTMGGILGDMLTMVDVGLHQWLLEIRGTQSGTIASPFSNH